MAIKGKSRSRGKRAVTSGPKPAYVEPRRPLLARRGVRLGLLAVAIVAAVAGIAYGTVKERNESRERDLRQRKQRTVRDYDGRVQAAIRGIGAEDQPGSFQLFPGLPETLKDLSRGKGSPKEIATQGKATGEGAASAAEAIEGIDAIGLVRDKGFDVTFVTYVLGSRDAMAQGLRVYEQVGATLEVAADAEGPEQQRDLVGVARDLEQTARQLFAGGYTDLTEAKASVGLFNPIPGAGFGPPVPPGLNP